MLLIAVCLLVWIALLIAGAFCTETVGFDHSRLMQIGFIALICSGIPLGFMLARLNP